MSFAKLICSAFVTFLLLMPVAATAQQPAPPAAQNVNPGSTPAAVQASSGKAARQLARQVAVSGSGSGWNDTGIDLLPGDKLILTSDGQIQSLAGQAVNPDGLQRGWADVLRNLPVNDAGVGALIGRIGDSAGAAAFLIGSKREITVRRAGRLFLGLNGSGDIGLGTFQVKMQIIPAANSASAAPASAPKFDAALLEQLPRRVSDSAGNAGDMVNFLVVGSEEQLRSAFEAGGWVLVDRTKTEAVLHAILSTTGKKAYTEMPMSELYLFGRAQDFGYAHAEPVTVVASRHHLRLWKAPFELQGQTVWAGAATHDMGFERDQRNGSVTHHIDPEVDVEREFLAATLNETGLVLSSTYLLPANAVQEARTATGGSFHSDGRLLVLYLSAK